MRRRTSAAMLEVPFGAPARCAASSPGSARATSEHELAEPLRVLEPGVPPELVELGAVDGRRVLLDAGARRWRSCCRPARRAARRRALVRREARRATPTRRARAHTSASAELLERSLPRWTGADTAALRRLRGARRSVRDRRRAGCGRRVRPRAGRRARRRRRPPADAPSRPRARADRDALDGAPASALLLHGVTGSGKTEVYLRAVGRALARGRSAIVLVPEIALTPQIVARFVERFGDTVAVLHSKLGAGERYDEWRRLRRGEARICVGPALGGVRAARPTSAWSSSTRSTTRPTSTRATRATTPARRRASARGRRARCSSAGSATPRPESCPRACARLRLPERVDGRRAAAGRDRRHARACAARCIRARATRSASTRAKAIVLLNRRGWSNFLTCRSLRARVWMCPECDVDARAAPRRRARSPATTAATASACRARCPACGSRVDRAPRHRHRAARGRARQASRRCPVFRLDADAPRRRRASLGALRARAERGVLVGTQMVAKGHDFPDVDARRRARRRRDAALPRLPRRGADVRARRAARRPRAAAARRRPRARADARARRARAPPRRAPRRRRLPRRRARAPRGAALPAVRDADPGRLLRPSEPGAGAGGRGRGARAGLAPGRRLGPAPLFRLRGRERAQLVVKAARAPRGDRARSGAAVRGRRRRPPRTAARSSASTSTRSSTAAPTMAEEPGTDVSRSRTPRGPAADSTPRSPSAGARGARARAPARRPGAARQGAPGRALRRRAARGGRADGRADGRRARHRPRRARRSASCTACSSTASSPTARSTRSSTRRSSGPATTRSRPRRAA